MLRIEIENIRTFSEKQAANIAPLTFLVGENSSGKTTFMAILAATLRGELFQINPDFNQNPFDLGSFDTLATYKGGRAGRADTFTVGFQSSRRNSEGECTVQSTFCSDRGQVRLSRFIGKSPRGSVSISIDDRSMSVKLKVAPLNSKGMVDLAYERTLQEDGGPPKSSILDLVSATAIDYLRSSAKRIEATGLDRFAIQRGAIRFFREFERSLYSPLALAPVRTKPSRTYDEVRSDFKPSGDHIPLVLSRLFQDKQQTFVIDALTRFGINSGLLTDLRVRRLGRAATDPFQVLIKGEKGPEANLTDVGYGVSQAIPIIIESSLLGKRKRLLMQQPEVHLHPRAQAALGTFLVEQVSMEDAQFVVETHSDYVIDRVRREIGSGNIKPSDVLILFFDRKGLDTTIHSITLDNAGNVCHAPNSYRAFFLREQESLFRRAK